MKIHEYQAKEILREVRRCRVPSGEMANTLEEADAVAAQSCLPRATTVVVVKAQIHAGGRGKGGGVKVAQDAGRGRDARRRRSSACSW